MLLLLLLLVLPLKMAFSLLLIALALIAAVRQLNLFQLLFQNFLPFLLQLLFGNRTVVLLI